MWKKTLSLIVFVFVFDVVLVCSQDSLNFNIPTVDYSSPHEYTVGGITISGVKYLDKSILVQLTGLTVGQKVLVPGSEITKSIRKLWDQGLFSDVKITYTKIDSGKIYLDYYLLERPRLSKIQFAGIRKSEVDDIQAKLIIRL